MYIYVCINVQLCDWISFQVTFMEREEAARLLQALDLTCLANKRLYTTLRSLTCWRMSKFRQCMLACVYSRTGGPMQNDAGPRTRPGCIRRVVSRSFSLISSTAKVLLRMITKTYIQARVLFEQCKFLRHACLHTYTFLSTTVCLIEIFAHP